MAKITLKAKAIRPIETRAEAEQVANETALRQLEIESQSTEREAALLLATQGIAEPFNAIIEPLEILNQNAVKRLEAWLENNQDELGDLKSTKLGAHTVGFTLGKWSTKVKKSIGWDSVTASLMKMLKSSRSKRTKALAEAFLRIKPEPNKLAMLDNRQLPVVVRFLRRLGVTFEQEETFFFTAGTETQPVETLRL